MVNITRVKASDNRKSTKPKTPKPQRSYVDRKAKRQTRKTIRAEKYQQKKGINKFLYNIYTFRFITAPIFAFGRYIRDSWREILLVRWPDRKLTWKLTLSIVVYTILITLIITGLDMLFNFLFDKVLV